MTSNKLIFCRLLTILYIHIHVFRPAQDSSVWLELTSREQLMSPECSKHQVLSLAKMLVVNEQKIFCSHQFSPECSMNKFRAYISTYTCFVLPRTHQCGSATYVLYICSICSICIMYIFELHLQVIRYIYICNSLKMSVLFDNWKSVQYYLGVPQWKCQYCLIWNLKKVFAIVGSNCLKVRILFYFLGQTYFYCIL